MSLPFKTDSTDTHKMSVMPILFKTDSTDTHKMIINKFNVDSIQDGFN